MGPNQMTEGSNARRVRTSGSGVGTLSKGPYVRPKETRMPVLGEIVGWEVLVPLALIALLFGSSKIPQLARSLGQAQNEFKKGAAGHHEETAEPEPAPAVEEPKSGEAGA
jgi:sec-independent protein translocase protein TatA